MACPVTSEYQDIDWAEIVYDFSMNFTPESARSGYFKLKEQEKTKASKDDLRQAGYSEEDIAQGRF